MEAALKYAAIHTAHSVAPVDQVTHWLLMESLAQVIILANTNLYCLSMNTL